MLTSSAHHTDDTYLIICEPMTIHTTQSTSPITPPLPPATNPMERNSGVVECIPLLSSRLGTAANCQSFPSLDYKLC